MRGNRGIRRARRQWRDAACAVLWIGALALVMLGGVLGLGRAIQRSRMETPALREVVLPAGGTLWGLAKRYGVPGQDPRAAAAQIRRLNGIRPGQTLHPGTRLLVPDYASGATELAQNSHRPG
ncbi:MAG TPA: LysM peptidoglycan-binding domain-containing protein [Armatimonadetes bacterium]|jgi:hypothetical protein|nr:LysM peptidoglycan-binding domain-containing protein [Armatimonadota bacterium]